MNKIQKMKMVGFIINPPSYRGNSKKSGVERAAPVTFQNKSDYGVSTREVSTRA